MCGMLILQMPFDWYGDQEAALREADDAARESLRLDSQDSNAHRNRGMVRIFQGRLEDAIDSLQSALKLNPNSADILGTAASAYGIAGDYDRAKRFLDRAVELSPNDAARPSWHSGTALGAFIAGQYDEVIEACNISIEMNPGFPTPYRQRASALALTGRLDEARRDVVKLLELAPDTNIRMTEKRVPMSGEKMEKFLEGLRAAGLPG